MIIDVNERTLKRWRSECGAVAEDQRPQATQGRQLTQEEEQAILNLTDPHEVDAIHHVTLEKSLLHAGLPEAMPKTARAQHQEAAGEAIPAQ
ncbi:hypothetical protein, partial [Vreelandella rituensis]|uniref:hypothetical protein n=1 Tax=Vreelandella rituensis TaxID=2282306 RepID=UPI0039F0B869